MDPNDILDYEPKKISKIENVTLNVFTGICVYMMGAPFMGKHLDFIKPIYEYDEPFNEFMFVSAGICATIALTIAFRNLSKLQEGQKYFAFIVNGVGMLEFLWWLYVVNFMI